jgi:hypothetical protein
MLVQVIMIDWDGFCLGMIGCDLVWLVGFGFGAGVGVGDAWVGGVF